MGVMERVAPRRKKAVALAPVTIEADRLLRGDCIAEMAKLPDGCIDMIFADPPYNLQLGGDLFRPEGGRVDAVDNDWDKFDTLGAYDRFTKAWLAQISVSCALVKRVPLKLGIGLALRQMMSFRIQNPSSCNAVPTRKIL